MYHEVGGRPPLNRQERFILSSLSGELTRDELLQRIQGTRKDPNTSPFPEFFGPAMLNSLVMGLVDKGLIKEIFVISEEGKKELEGGKKLVVRPPAPEVRPYPRRAEPATRELPRPSPQVRLVEPPRTQPKKDKSQRVRLKTFSDLGKHFPPADGVEK